MGLWHRGAGAYIKNRKEVPDNALAAFDDHTVFIFGPAFDPEKMTGGKDDLNAMQDYLVKPPDFAGREVKTGKSNEEIPKENSTPGVTELRGAGFER
jgi:hypothetical protein